MPLTGTFPRSLDDKLRVAIPKGLRDAIGPSAEGVLYMTPGTDGSLAIYTEEAFGRLADRLGEASPAGSDVRAFGRLFYSQAERLESDQQGRVRVPPELARWAGLEREVVLLGVHDHMELWDRARWESYLAERQGRFDEIAEAALDRPKSK